MYTITIKNFYRSGKLAKDETILYHVPIQDDEIENVLVDPSVSGDIDKTGTFEFTIHPNHPYYHAIAQMRTILRVEYDGDTIFRGRVLTIDNTMSGAKRVHCEGDLAFLLDSVQMGVSEGSRESRTLHDYIVALLDTHNKQMQESEETDKCIYPGYIPGAYPSSFSESQTIKNESDKFGSDGTEKTMDSLETLSGRFGGFFRTRYSSQDKKTYLDWCRLWFRKDLEHGQPIAITQNIIDANSNSEVDNIFTALIPIGSSEGKEVFITGYKTDIHGDNNRILVPQITKVYSESELKFGYMSKEIYEQAVEQYGIIYKVQKFQNANTAEKLWEYACDWIKNNYVGGITSYDLSAMDMHHVDNQVVKYLVGDCVTLKIHTDMASYDDLNSSRQDTIFDDVDPSGREVTVNRTLLTVKYDLHHPEKNSYTAGIPSDILNHEYGSKSTSKNAKSGGSGKGAGARGGSNQRDTEKIGGDSELTEEELKTLAWRYLITPEYNNDIYQDLYRTSPERAAAAERASHIRLMEEIRGAEVLEDGSLEERYYGMATTLMLDAEMGVLNFLRPVVNAFGFGPLGRRITDLRATTSLTIDGYNGYLGMRQIPTYHQVADDIINLFNRGVDLIRNGGSSEGEAEGDAIKTDPLSVFGLQAGQLGADMSFFTGDSNDDNTITASIRGAMGRFGAMVGAYGADGSGDPEKATIIEDGSGNEGEGTVNVGKNESGWLIQMNQPLQWQDEHGNVFTVPHGTIDAKDYSMLKEAQGNSIASFSTKFAVIDTLVAQNIDAISIKANQIDVDNLTARVADIDQVIARKVDADQVVSIVTSSDITTSRSLTVNGNFIYKTNRCIWRTFKDGDGTYHTYLVAE